MEDNIILTKERISQLLFNNISQIIGGKVKKSDISNWLSRKTKSLLYADSIKFTLSLRSIYDSIETTSTSSIID